MTQEMGESLMYSWLRHVKECRFVQTNWRISSCWELNPNYVSQAENYYKQLSKFLSVRNFRQALYQTECDVMGLAKNSMTDMGKVFGIEVAYHKDGLHYNENYTNNSQQKVVQKLIMTALCIYSNFGNLKAEIIFATPKTNPTLQKAIKTDVDSLNNWAISNKLNYVFRFITNDDFKYVFIDPVYIMCKGIYDASELFLRSFQLVDLLGLLNIKSHLTNPQSFDEFGGVAEIANKALRACLRNKTISKKMISTLNGLTGSFMPLVKNIPPELSSRYYIRPVRTKSGDYYLCNHWIATSKTSLINFIINNI